MTFPLFSSVVFRLGLGFLFLLLFLPVLFNVFISTEPKHSQKNSALTFHALKVRRLSTIPTQYQTDKAEGKTGEE